MREMDVLNYRSTTTPHFPPYPVNSKVFDPPHDAEYIVPPSSRFHHDIHPGHKSNHGWTFHGPDSYYLPHAQQHNIWIDRKNHDRIQNWLSEQHEFTGYPPPEEESISSLRSSSAVDVLNDRSPIEEIRGYFPKYKSEERIHTTQSDADEQKRSSAFRRYNSPDCIRRRYFSPRSDPNLNTAGKPQTFLPARSVSYKHLPRWSNGTNENNPEYLNRAFYQGGKGNTFPRRNRLAARNASRTLLNTNSTEEMGQHLEKYQQNVLLNPYASVNTNRDHHDNKHCDPYINESKKLDFNNEQTRLAGRTFVLNGISLQGRQGNEGSGGKGSSVVVNSSTITPGQSTEVIETSKTSEKSSGISNKSGKSTPIKQTVTTSFHLRVASAPATTDSNKLDRDLYWRNLDGKRCVSPEVRKVKALSWPKRAVLPVQADVKFVENYTKQMSEGEEDEHSEKQDDEKDVDDCELKDNYAANERVDDIGKVADDEDALSDQSDVPPARPPLPPEHMYVRDGSHSSGRASSKRSSQYSQAHLEITEETIVPETKNDTYELNKDDSTGSVYSSDGRHSVSSEQYYHHSGNCELSKKVSMSLKDLIRIHEKEIARVSGAFSTRALDKIEERTRKTSFTREERKRSLHHAKWKRHTTIGILGDFSHDTTDDVIDNNTVFSDTNRKYSDTDRQLSEQFHRDTSDKDILSPTSTSRKFNLRINSVTTSEGSEASLLSPRLQQGFKSPPSTLPKPKKVTTSSMVTSPLQTVVSPPHILQTHGQFEVPIGMSHTMYTSDSSVQTDDQLVRSPSIRKNENRLKELTEENEKMKQAFEEERKELNKKLQEQMKLANAYQKLEDRYRKKVYELQKAMKVCTCSPSRYSTYSSRGDGDNYRPDSSIGDSNEISVQKVDVILNKLEAWLNHHTTGISYPESEISSLFGSTHEDIYTRNNKRPHEHYGGNGTIPLDRIIDRIDATSV